jgi:hypothetical protein
MERFRRFRRDRGAVATASEAVEARPADAGTDSARDVQVIYGASVQTLALAGLTLAQARPLVETILAVDHRSPALVNGQTARANYVIARGDALEFVHHAGEKGCAPWMYVSRLSRTRSCAARMGPRRSPRR